MGARPSHVLPCQPRLPVSHQETCSCSAGVGPRGMSLHRLEREILPQNSPPKEKEDKTLPRLVLSPVSHQLNSPLCGESVPSHFHVIWRLSKPHGSHTPHCGRLRDGHSLLPRTCVTLYGRRNVADVITQRILRSSTCIQCNHVSL